MYIQRDEIEKALYRSVLGSMHTFLFGESGNGKSWMYKKVLSEKKINFVVANCASASRNKSITSDLMDELSDIIILLDDERYARYQVKFLIVGVPNEVIQYFSSVKNPSSVGNRIEEIPRVTGLDYKQVLELVERGFVKYLKVNLSEIEKKRLSRHIFDVTLGVPQKIHEYCIKLGYLIEDNNWEYKLELLDDADHQWLLQGLRESYAVIDGYFIF